MSDQARLPDQALTNRPQKMFRSIIATNQDDINDSHTSSEESELPGSGTRRLNGAGPLVTSVNGGLARKHSNRGPVHDHSSANHGGSSSNNERSSSADSDGQRGLFVRRVLEAENKGPIARDLNMDRPISPYNGGSCTHCSQHDLCGSNANVHHQRTLSPGLPRRYGSRRSSASHDPVGDGEAAKVASHISRATSNASTLAERIKQDMQLAAIKLPDMPRQAPPRVTRKRKQKQAKPVYKVPAFQFLEQLLHKALWHLAKLIGHYSTILMLIPLVAFLLCLIGLVVGYSSLSFQPPFPSFVTEAVDEEVIDRHHHVQTVYTVSYNGSNPTFSAINRNSKTDFAVLFKTTNPKGSVLTEIAVDEYTRIKTLLENMMVKDENGKMIEWAQMCRDECGTDDVIETILGSDVSVSLTYPETYVTLQGEKNASRLFLGNSIGGVETDVDGVIARARSLGMQLRLREDLSNKATSDWEQAFRSLLINSIERPTASEKKSSLLTMFWSKGSFTDTVAKTMAKLHHWLPLCLLILFLLCLLMAFSKNSYTSKPFLGLAIGFIVALSAFGGFSVAFSGARFLNPLAFPAAFVLLAIAILLCMSLLIAWRKYDNASVHPAEKFALVMSWDGPGCVLAIFCLSISMLIAGTAVHTPYLRFLNFTMTVSLLLLLLFMFLFYMVLFHLCGRRELKGVKWYRFWERGDTHFAAPLIQEYDEVDTALLHEKLIDLRPSFSRVLGSSMARVHMRYLAVMLFAVYLVFATWGCTNAQADLKEDYFLPKDSYPRQYLEDYRHFFGRYEEYVEVSFEEILDYHNPRTREQIFGLLDWAKEQQYATRVVSWLYDFVRFEQSSIYVINQDTFVPVVNLVFLNTEPFKRYAADLAFDKYHSQIIGSRMYLELSVIGVNQRLELMNGLRERASRAGLPLKVRAPFVFMTDHDSQLTVSILTAFLVSTGFYAAFAFFLLAQPSMAFLVLFTCTSTMVGVVGYCVVWQVPLNVVTLGVSVIANSFTACVVIVFCYHFASSGSNQSSGVQRVEYAFQSTWCPMLAACIVPLLAYLPLFVIDAPIVLHIWKTLFLVISAAFGHYLFILPSVMVILTEHLSQCYAWLKEVLEETCCACCDVEEDAGSIYYIPTGGRSLDPDTLRRYVNSRYGDLNVEPLPICGPPRREMIMPPPPNYLAYVPQIMGPDLLHYHPHMQSHMGRREDLRTHSPAHSQQNRTSRSVSPESNKPYRVSGPNSPQVQSPDPSRRSFCPQADDGRSAEESIYEEPPSLASQPVYIPRSGADGRSRMVNERHRKHRRGGDKGDANRRSCRHSEHRNRGDRDEVCSMDDGYGSRGDHHHNGQREKNQNSDRNMGMQPNWRQYLLDGSMRQSGPGGEMIGPPPPQLAGLLPPVPMCIAPMGPPPPPPQMGHHPMIRNGQPRCSTRGLARLG